MPLTRKLIDSTKFSVAGLVFAWRNEPSLRLEAGVVVVVVLLGWLRQLDAARWVLVSLAWALVISSELMNTAIEALADYVQPKRDYKQASVYDAASAAVFVLIVFAGAVTVLSLIWPH